MWILLTAYNDQCNGISQANNQEIQQLSDHTYLRSDLTKLHNAGKRRQMKPPLIESVSQDYIPLAGKHLISPFGTVTLQSFPRNYTLLMLCNLARQNLGSSDTVIDISRRCFFPMASMKRPGLITVRLGFLSLRLNVVPLTAHGHDSTLCF